MFGQTTSASFGARTKGVSFGGRAKRAARNQDRVDRNGIQAKDQGIPGPFYVQGYKASDLEFTCYQALLALGWTDADIEFQKNTLGGRLPGGQVLDFVVHSPGGDIVIAVDGDAWHNRTEAQRQDDLFQQQRISKALGYEVIFVKANSGDMMNLAVAVNFLERWVGHGGAV